MLKDTTSYPNKKCASWYINTINDQYSDLNDVQRLKARKVLRLCKEAVDNGVLRDKHTFHGDPLPEGYVYKFDELLNEAHNLYITINDQERNTIMNAYEIYDIINNAVSCADSVEVYTASKQFENDLKLFISTSEDMWYEGEIQNGWINTHWTIAHFLEANNQLLDIVKDQLPELVNFFNSIKDTVKCNIQD